MAHRVLRYSLLLIAVVAIATALLANRGARDGMDQLEPDVTIRIGEGGTYVAAVVSIDDKTAIDARDPKLRQLLTTHLKKHQQPRVLLLIGGGVQHRTVQHLRDLVSAAAPQAKIFVALDAEGEAIASASPVFSASLWFFT